MQSGATSLFCGIKCGQRLVLISLQRGFLHVPVPPPVVGHKCGTQNVLVQTELCVLNLWKYYVTLWLKPLDHVQWNLSAMIGTTWSVPMKEVSELFQRLFCTLLNVHVAGTTDSVLVREVSLFLRSLMERFQCGLHVFVMKSVKFMPSKYLSVYCCPLLAIWRL